MRSPKCVSLFQLFSETAVSLLSRSHSLLPSRREKVRETHCIKTAISLLKHIQRRGNASALVRQTFCSCLSASCEHFPECQIHSESQIYRWWSCLTSPAPPPKKTPSLSFLAPIVFAESIPRKQGVCSDNGATGCNYVMLVELNNYSGGAKIARWMAQCDKALLRLNREWERFHSERNVGTVPFFFQTPSKPLGIKHLNTRWE